MQQHITFLKVSSVIVKISAWIILFLGVIVAISSFSGIMGSELPRWVGLIVMAVYTFASFILFLISKITEILVDIVEGKSGN
jgi:uncharacterized RDD family membrane protein YckC